MKQERSRLIFLEGAQGAGKTLAVGKLGEAGLKTVRGIPDGEKLSTNSETDNWIESLSIISRCLDEGGMFAIDRSFWSLVVYNMRKKPEAADLIYRLGSSLFSRCTDSKSYLLVIVDVEPKVSLEREDKEGLMARDGMTEAISEVDSYRDLAKRLINDGYNVVVIENSNLEEADFEKALRLLLSTID